MSKWFVFHDHHCGLEVSGDILAMWREAGGLQWRDVMLAFPTCRYNRYNQFMFTRPGALGIVLGKGRGLRNAYLRGKRVEVEVLLGGCGYFQVENGFLDPSADTIYQTYLAGKFRDVGGSQSIDDTGKMAGNDLGAV